MEKLELLKSNVDDTLYDIFLGSNECDWVCKSQTLHKYLQDNISFWLIEKEDNWDLTIIIHPDISEAKSMPNLLSIKYTTNYDNIYSLDNRMVSNWFSNSLTKKLYVKHKAILSYLKDSEEFDRLNRAFNSLPKKLMRKKKLEKLGDTNYFPKRKGYIHENGLES